MTIRRPDRSDDPTKINRQFDIPLACKCGHRSFFLYEYDPPKARCKLCLEDVPLNVRKQAYN